MRCLFLILYNITMCINKNLCYNFGGPCDSDQTGLSRGLPIHILQSLIMFKYFFCIYICGSNKWNSDSDSNKKGNDAVLLNRLGAVSNPSPLDKLLVDTSQVLYHIVWPLSGTMGEIAEGTWSRLINFNGVETYVPFDRYDGTVRQITKGRWEQ